MVKLFTLILILSFLIQIYYWVFIFRKICSSSAFKPETELIPLPSVTLIICVNDKHAPILEQNINAFTKQDYPNLEIMIMFNGIDTAKLGNLNFLSTNHPGLTIHNAAPGNQFSKRKSLIQAARLVNTEYVILTDADCLPVSSQWIKTMIHKAINTKADILLAFSPVVVNKNNIQSLWAYYECFITAIQYLSFCLKGYAYMGVGRNLVYKSNLFTSELLESHAELPFGDDDLSVNLLAGNCHIDICIHPDSFVNTDAPSSWKAYYSQKRRHFSTSRFYRMSDKIRLSLYSGSQVFLYAGILIHLGTGAYLIAAGIYVLRLIIIFPVVSCTRSKLKSAFRNWDFLLLDLMQALFYLIFAITMLLPAKKSW